MGKSSLEADRQAEAAAFEPFEPDDFSTPGEGFDVLPCPSKLPHDIEPGEKIARWFGPPYNGWYMGKVIEVNKRRTKQENVCVAFEDGNGMFLADAESYGADKLWCLLKPIPIELDDDSEDGQACEEAGEPAAKRAKTDGASGSS